MDDDFLDAFTAVIREKLSQNWKVELKDIGMFSREHHKQYQQQYQNGRVVMMPPKDTIKFVAHSELTNGD